MPKRIDFYTREDWNLPAKGSRNDYLSRISNARDPLGWFSGPIPHAVWGFDTNRSDLRILLGRPLASFRAMDDPFTDRREQIKLYIELAPILVSLRRHNPRIHEVVKIFLSEKRRTTGNEVYATVAACLKSEYELHWVELDQCVMCGLFDKRIVLNPEGDVDLSKRAAADFVLARLYDYHIVRHTVWDRVPSALFSLGNQNLVGRLFADPLVFSPGACLPTDVFLWPWQRCLRLTPPGMLPGACDYTAIETTSLVLDLRGSTTTMALTGEAARYASFLDSVVSCARRTLTEYGGFFDKETGDGIVGHFCHAVSTAIPSSTRSVPGRAVSAAVAMIRRINDLCVEHQKHLEQGLDGLGPAVGVHTGKAVWIVSGDQIRAIGPAVVWAARLCETAQPNEIVMSNQSFKQYGATASPGEMAMFAKRRIEVKEFASGMRLYGFGAQVMGSGV